MSFNTHTILKGKNNALVHWKGYYVTISLRIYYTLFVENPQNFQSKEAMTK